VGIFSFIVKVSFADRSSEFRMMEANLAWADCVKVVTGYSGQLNTTPLGVQAAIGKELFFMTVLMLHA